MKKKVLAIVIGDAVFSCGRKKFRKGEKFYIEERLLKYHPADLAVSGNTIDQVMRNVGEGALLDDDAAEEEVGVAEDSELAEYSLKDLRKMSKTDLLRLGERLGLDIDESTNKAEIVDNIYGNLA